MIKITTIVSLILICSILCDAGKNCNSCGRECVSACGTRMFRLCCFNYLRRKRDPETMKFSAPHMHEKEAARLQVLGSVYENPDLWAVINEDKPTLLEDLFENSERLQALDA